MNALDDLGRNKFCPESRNVAPPTGPSHGSLFEVSLAAGIRQAFCFIPPGKFTMGSPPGEDGYCDNENQVQVTLSQSFWLARTQVTQAQWEAIMGGNPSEFRGANRPVENISWEDAQAFIAKLNDRRILPEDWKFALPTEAQWEYACRAGVKGPFSGGSIDAVGWYAKNSGATTHEVGRKKANAWGLQDMHGNLCECCADWYGERLKGGVDPSGPASGDARVFRGGFFFEDASGCRAASRGWYRPDGRNSGLGLRIAFVPSK